MTPMTLNVTDIEAIERATVAAVSPDLTEEIDGWLLPFAEGTVKRAKSAVPLHRGAVEPATLDRIEDRYASRQAAPALRLADAPCFEGLRAELERRRYKADTPTCVQAGSAQRMRQVAAPGVAPADVDSAPDDAWAALFLGEGFDPVDGAHRVRMLSRAKGTLYASVREGGRTVAAGAAGSMLALSGFTLQRISGNPLASPEMLGLGAGAGLAAGVCGRVPCTMVTLAPSTTAQPFCRALATSLVYSLPQR